MGYKADIWANLEGALFLCPFSGLQRMEEEHIVENNTTTGGDEGPDEKNTDELATGPCSNEHPAPQETDHQPPSHRYPRRDRRPPQPWRTFTTATSALNAQLQITTPDEPTLGEAFHSTPAERDLWLQAIEEETKTLNHMSTWEPADRAEHAPLPTHVVLKVKLNADTTVERLELALWPVEIIKCMDMTTRRRMHQWSIFQWFVFSST